MSTNLEYRERESRRQARKAKREKERQRASARDQEQKRHFFVGRTTLKSFIGGEKMRNANGLQGENVRQ